MRGLVGLKRMFVASVIAISAISTYASVAQAATVSELIVQYPDGGDDFDIAVRGLFQIDPVGTASAIAQAWGAANEAQRAGMSWSVGRIVCTGTPNTDAAVMALLPFTTEKCDRYGNKLQSTFDETATGDDEGSGFGGGSISPNTQENPNNEQ